MQLNLRKIISDASVVTERAKFWAHAKWDLSVRYDDCFFYTDFCHYNEYFIKLTFGYLPSPANWQSVSKNDFFWPWLRFLWFLLTLTSCHSVRVCYWTYVMVYTPLESLFVWNCSYHSYSQRKCVIHSKYPRINTIFLWLKTQSFWVRTAIFSACKKYPHIFAFSITVQMKDFYIWPIFNTFWMQDDRLVNSGFCFFFLWAVFSLVIKDRAFLCFHLYNIWFI